MTTSENGPQNYGTILPKDFLTFVPNLEKRITQSLDKPPLAGLIYNKPGWTPHFSGIVENAEKVSKERQICAHSLDNHLFQVTQNAFAMAGAIGTNTAQEPSVITDSNLAFVALTHDLGYADPSLVWSDKAAPGHTEASVKYIDDMRKRGSVVFPIPNGIHESIETLDANFDLYEDTILAMSDTPSTLLRTADQIKQNPTEEGQLQLVMMLADKIDFFRSARLEGIDPPSGQIENPYFRLANAISDYSLAVNPDTITYSVKLKDHAPGQKWTLEKWKQEVEKADYGWIFEIGEIFAGINGRKFKITEMQSAT